MRFRGCQVSFKEGEAEGGSLRGTEKVRTDEPWNMAVKNKRPLSMILWMDKILHQIETMGNQCALVFTGESSFHGLLGDAKRILSIHSIIADCHPQDLRPESS